MLEGMTKKELEKLEERFWKKVTESDPFSCWEWKASRNPNGYGVFTIANKSAMAHRVAYALRVGAIPKGMIVRHSCDNPGCVNVNHLKLGTQADNMRDRMQRNPTNSVTGVKQLGWEKVAELRERYANGESQAELAVAFGTTPANVSHIIVGRSWKVA